jgi:hypothetical protein
MSKKNESEIYPKGKEEAIEALRQSTCQRCQNFSESVQMQDVHLFDEEITESSVKAPLQKYMEMLCKDTGQKIHANNNK